MSLCLNYGGAVAPQATELDLFRSQIRDALIDCRVAPAMAVKVAIDVPSVTTAQVAQLHSTETDLGHGYVTTDYRPHRDSTGEVDGYQIRVAGQGSWVGSVLRGWESIFD